MFAADAIEAHDSILWQLYSRHRRQLKVPLLMPRQVDVQAPGQLSQRPAPMGMPSHCRWPTSLHCCQLALRSTRLQDTLRFVPWLGHPSCGPFGHRLLSKAVFTAPRPGRWTELQA